MSTRAEVVHFIAKWRKTVFSSNGFGLIYIAIYPHSIITANVRPPSASTDFFNFSETRACSYGVSGRLESIKQGAERSSVRSVGRNAAYIYIHIYLYIYIYIFTYVYIYTSISISIHTHTYVYIYFLCVCCALVRCEWVFVFAV